MVPPDDDYDIGSDALSRPTAQNLTSGCISGLRVAQRLDGAEFVVIELLAERKAEFGSAIRESLGEIPFEFDEVQPGPGILYGPPPSGTGWCARRRDARMRRKIVRRHAREI